MKIGEKLSRFFKIFLATVIIAGGGTCLALFARNTQAISADDTTSYVKVDEIYSDSMSAFNATNLNTLLKFITGDSSITYENATSTLDTLATNTTSSADIRANSLTVNGITKSSSQDIIVRFGGLDWQVVYLSKDTDGNNILTLWLSSSQQEAFTAYEDADGEYYTFSDGALSSQWGCDSYYQTNKTYPTNMYSSSYMRTVTLNNGGTYVYNVGHFNLDTRYASPSTESVFARFTMTNVVNSLTQYFVTPNKMEWQLYQSSVEYCPSFTSYYLQNDSLNDPSTIGLAGRWYNSSTQFSNNYTNKTGYADWGNDYIWLPSIAEAAVGGIWKTSGTQRANRSATWLRSGGGYEGYDNTGLSAFMLNPNADLSGSAYNYATDVKNSMAVRPALHLNLNSVLSNTAPQVFEIGLENNGGTGRNEIFVEYGNGFFLDENLTTQITSFSRYLPTRPGYDFLGYYTRNNTSSTRMISSNGSFTSSFTPTYFSANTTLYAQWEPSTLTITLNKNGGSGGTSTIYMKYATGWYSDSGATSSMSSVSRPTRDGFSFNGYYTSPSSGTRIIDASGNIVGSNSFTTTNITLYAHWTANNPAQYDSTGGYWYIENGKMPQSKVEDSATSTYLSTNWSSLSNGSVYTMGELSLQSKVYGGDEYCTYNGNYYLVEPIRWRLTYTSSQTTGYGTTTDTLAVMATIVYVGNYSTSAINEGQGYSSTAVEILAGASASVSSTTGNNGINSHYLSSMTESMPTFGTTSLFGTPTSVTSNIFVSSVDEINSVAGSGKVKFSDLVADYLHANGNDLIYYTRDLGTNLNNIVCLSMDGMVTQRKPNSNFLGVQFTIKVTEYACV